MVSDKLTFSRFCSQTFYVVYDAEFSSEVEYHTTRPTLGVFLMYSHGSIDATQSVSVDQPAIVRYVTVLWYESYRTITFGINQKLCWEVCDSDQC